MNRNAFTLVEMLVGSALFMAILCTLHSLASSASRSTASSVDSSDAVRATLIASEAIRQDANRMLVKDLQQDLYIQEDGRGVAFRIPTIANDFWASASEPVGFGIEPLPGSADGNRLIREDSRGRLPVTGCVLRDLLVRYIRSPLPSNSTDYLEFTIVGMGLADSSTYTAVLLIPVTPVTPPSPYRASRRRS